MNKNPWQSKAEKLARLAEAKRGKPEGDVALAKLTLILSKHPEVRKQTVQDRPLLEADLELMSLKDLVVEADSGEGLHGIPLEGHWEGPTMEVSLVLMLQDYIRRKNARENQSIAAGQLLLKKGKL